MKVTGDKLELRRQTEDGWEIVESSTPAVISVTNDGGNLPRIPKVKDNMMAFRSQIPSWTADALGVSTAELAGANGALEMKNLYIPVIERNCEMIAGDNSTERAQRLVEKLVAFHVI